MSWAKERLRSSLARVAACADDTWALQPQDPFLLANQHAWGQYWRVSRALQYLPESAQETVAKENVTLTVATAAATRTQKDEGSRPAWADESDEARGRQVTVRDVIPQSRLAGYGNYNYDNDRELLYTSDNWNVQFGCHSGHSPVSDLTECWMLPKVDYWFRRLTDGGQGRRRDPLSAPADHLERYDPAQCMDPAEYALGKRLRSVRHLWPPSSHSYHITVSTATSPLQLSPITTSPNGSTSTSSSLPTPSRSPPLKIRVRRRTSRKPPRCAQPQTQPTYCPDSPKPLHCDPNTKIHFDLPLKQAQESKQKKQPVQTNETSENRTIQRPTSALSIAKQTPRGKSVDSRSKIPARPTYSRIAGKAPARAKSIRAERSGRSHDKRPSEETSKPKRPKSAKNTARSLPTVKSIIGAERSQKRNIKRESTSANAKTSVAIAEKVDDTCQLRNQNDLSGVEKAVDTAIETKQEIILELQPKVDEPVSTESMAQEQAIANQKRLYSTVLSTLPPIIITPPIACKIQGLVKLTSKLSFPVISRKVAPVDSKYEELEREALEQYKTSDESIDSKFKALEKQAMDQYSGSGTSNSNTSCSSGQSGAPCKNVHCSRCKCQATQCGGEKSVQCGERSVQCGMGVTSEQSVQCDMGHCTTERGKCVEQSNSGQCNEESSSGQCTEQCGSGCPTEQVTDSNDQKNKCSSKSNKKSPRVPPVDNAQNHSENVTDLTRTSTSSTVDLKNLHVPLRGEKKESNRQGRSPRLKPQRTASDTEESGRGRAPQRWTLYVMPSRKRGGKSSDEEEAAKKKEGAGRDAKVSAHGAGDHDAAKYQLSDSMQSAITLN